MTYTLEEYRILSDLYLVYACQGNLGRDESDPVYQAITEGRDTGAMRAKYSSCGDLAHWLHFRLGMRGSWVNRRECRGWKVGQNVSRLTYNTMVDTRPEWPVHVDAGDICIIWNRPDGTDAHVILCRGPLLGESLQTAEYGQPGGALRVRTLSQSTMQIGTRRLQRILSLPRALDTCAGSGLLVAPDKRVGGAAIAFGEGYFDGDTLDGCEKLLARPWAL